MFFLVGWFFASAGPMKTRKVKDMWLSLENLVTSCFWTGPHAVPTSRDVSPSLTPGKQASLLARQLSAWFLSSPGGCSSPGLTALCLLLSTVHPAQSRLWARAQLVPRASPSPFQLPFGHRTVCPSSMFLTRVVIPLEASERGMPRGCSHSITEARKYHACPVY